MPNTFGAPALIAASPEVARDMIIASRNRRLANLMNDSLFESELKSFRFTLVEQREHLLSAYGCSASNDICKIILVLLNCTNTFLKLFPGKNIPLVERPCDAVKEKMGIVAGVALVSSEKYAGRNGVHGSYVMENNLSRNSTQEVIKGDPRINSTSAG